METDAKLHSWERCPDPNPEVARHDVHRARVTRGRVKGPGPPTFWVRCGGCGTMVVTDEAHFPDECHVGWRVSPNCDLVVVEGVMEE